MGVNRFRNTILTCLGEFCGIYSLMPISRIDICLGVELHSKPVDVAYKTTEVLASATMFDQSL